MVLIFGVIIGWAAFVKLDTFVVAPGMVVIKTFKKPVQYKNWATVSRVFVKEGQFVKKGDPLIEIERLEQNATYEITIANYCYLLAERDRIVSELKGKKTIQFSKEFLKCPERLKQKFMKTQKKVFLERIRKLETNLKVLDAQKNQVLEKLKGLKEVLDIKRKLLNSTESEITEQEVLLKEGLVTKTRLIELKKRRDDLEADIENILSSINSYNSQLDQIEHQKRYIIKSYLDELSSKLQEVNAKLSEIYPRIILAKKQLQKTVIRAEISGRILGLKVHNPGEVIKPGETLMYIVPRPDKIFVLAKVSPKDRDKVFVGELVDLQFPSFISIGANAIEGKITYVANDVLYDEIRHYPYYEIHVELTEKGKKQLKKYGFELVPGMPAVAFIRVEKVSPLAYVLQPVLMIVKSAFHSP